MRTANYRLVVGEKGNTFGRIWDCHAKSLEGARRALKRRMADQSCDAWGIICDVIRSGGDCQYPRLERHGEPRKGDTK